MDKETLSNYGWIVICVLVLAVMIALATPFGKFISNAVQNTTQGLFDVNQKALNQTGLITIEDQEFTVPNNSNETETSTFTFTIIDYSNNNAGETKTFCSENDMSWEQWIKSKYNTEGFYVENSIITTGKAILYCGGNYIGNSVYVQTSMIVGESNYLLISPQPGGSND